MGNYFLPGFAGQIAVDSENAAEAQITPLLNLYSPRLFGAPPQLTNQCDMRLKSSMNGNPGPVGDFYLDNVLRNAQCANFVVGHAMFNGGMTSLWNLIRTAGQYANALKHYRIFGEGGSDDIRQTGVIEQVARENDQAAYNKALGEDDGKVAGMVRASELDIEGVEADSDAYVLDVSQLGDEANYIFENIGDMFEAGGVAAVGGGLIGSLKAAKGIQQAYYVFEADWNSYINNVKMMINSAIMMLGLQDAKVRIGDTLYQIGVGPKVNANTDVWTNYRFITPTDESGKVGAVNAVETLSGDNTQYVSFMIEPGSVSESYSNQVGDSQIYSTVLNQGSAIGNEIAFLTNTSRNAVDDALLNLTGNAINLAESVMQNLTLGTGRFTAAILGSMARSYTGDHTIFPQIFQSHTSTSNVSLTIKLRANAGDPYSYLIDILVPLFHLMCLAIPDMSKNAASAYSYPPLVQLNIPGIWGTRLGMVTSLTVDKNADGNDFSVNGYPLSVNVSVQVTDLQHVIMSSGMDKPALMLNNSTMFDYIAQCAGVDKYRINGAIRQVTKIALATSYGSNWFYNFGNTIRSWGASMINKWSGNSGV